MVQLSEKEISEYQEIARKIRREVLEMIYRTKSPHIGAALSPIEILVTLYFRCLNISPQSPQDENRDRFILSKGHGCPALYATLAQRGFFSKDVLDGFAKNGGTLEQHPTRNISWGIEASTGSLGHGLSMGAGMAIAAKHDQLNHRIFVLLSDGELEENSVWEAALFSSHHKLDNLIAIIDYNKLQALGRVEEIANLEPLKEKWQAFGWETKEIDGHNFEQIINAFEKIPFKPQKPSIIIAHTIKGKGISFMENNLLWHSKYPNEKEYKKALKELS